MAALAVPSTALAAFKPKLVVSHTPPNVSASTTSILIQLTRDDDALAKLTFYVPLGYRGELTQAVNTQLGTVQSRVQATAISDDAIIPINGVVRVADGTQAAIAGASLQCTQTATHTAFWVLALEAAGQQLAVPVFVDTVSAGPEAAFASFKLQICLPPPATAAQGAKVLEATLALQNVFTAPTTAGQFVWPGIFTPYASKAGPINPAGTVEARGIVRLPAQVTLKGKITSKKKRTIRLSGTVTENRQGVAGVTVEILIGSRALLKVTTNGSGAFSVNLKRTGKGKVTTVFRARARVGARDATSVGCAGPSGAPAGCVSATLGAFTANSPGVRIRL
jgi:hypothetical protein